MLCEGGLNVEEEEELNQPNILWNKIYTRPLLILLLRSGFYYTHLVVRPDPVPVAASTNLGEYAAEHLT